MPDSGAVTAADGTPAPAAGTAFTGTLPCNAALTGSPARFMAFSTSSAAHILVCADITLVSA